jgi:hypothetical protein
MSIGSRPQGRRIPWGHSLLAIGGVVPLAGRVDDHQEPGHHEQHTDNGRHGRIAAGGGRVPGMVDVTVDPWFAMASVWTLAWLAAPVVSRRPPFW